MGRPQQQARLVCCRQRLEAHGGIDYVLPVNQSAPADLARRDEIGIISATDAEHIYLCWLNIKTDQCLAHCHYYGVVGPDTAIDQMVRPVLEGREEGGRSRGCEPDIDRLLTPVELVVRMMRCLIDENLFVRAIECWNAKADDLTGLAVGWKLLGAVAASACIASVSRAQFNEARSKKLPNATSARTRNRRSRRKPAL